MNTDQMLLLFEEPLEGKLLREVRELKLSVDRVRKGQFAKLGELTKKYNALLEDMELLKAHICRPECKAVLHEKVVEMVAM
jgi:hypothetical protein